MSTELGTAPPRTGPAAPSAAPPAAPSAGPPAAPSAGRPAAPSAGRPAAPPAEPRAARPAARRLRLGFTGLALLGALASGCGIRSTSVPVDAGAAPSRVSCVLPGDRESSDGADGGNLPVRVYLSCGSRVSPVDRRVVLPDGDDSQRLPVARGLLDALQTRPDSDEEAAGFKTAVPRGLKVYGAREGDPPAALRLSEPLEDLPSFALAQIVCTYADTAAAGADRSVILGGPDVAGEGDDSLRLFRCDTALRTRPEAAATAGTRL